MDLLSSRTARRSAVSTVAVLAVSTALAGAGGPAAGAAASAASAATNTTNTTNTTAATTGTTASGPAAASASSYAWQEYPGPGYVTGDIGVHDPTVVRAHDDGTYILAHTAPNIALKTSTDRTEWRDAGVVWPQGAPWTTEYTGGDPNLWAPDLSYHDGLYYLYYSASTFGSQRSAIFLATSPTAEAGSWTHRGLVIESSGSVDYNAIDPNLIVTPEGEWWLSFGSFWSGIKLIRIDPSTGLRDGADMQVRALADRRSTGSSAVEAPVIYRHGDQYYLFVSFDLCCRGADSTYRIMVGRASSVTGPYVDRSGRRLLDGGGTEVLAGHGSFHGTGHQAVIPDVDADVLFYHYYADNDAALLGINLLGWDDGWPYVH